ncbi:hypothetical protein OXIME_001409 [Oxyplasma meridianum]|uniref:Aspartate/glutamate/uridylate kinase domain-containing protein n=1 Tax=Oxyplasma meridianum TaxID=3073602 RepID=A0AAX4NI07_9ARCH
MESGDIRVMKFGGSCLADAENLSRVLDIIWGEKNCIVVMSAFKSVTDTIRSFIYCDGGNIDVRGLSNFLSERHMAIARSLLTGPHLAEFEEGLSSCLDLIKLYVLTITEDPANIEKHSAFLQSFGEKISVLLVAAALRQKGLPAEKYFADSLGIITRGGHLNGTVSMEETAGNIRRPLTEAVFDGKIPVVTGYIGRNDKGETTLLGRDGSDYTASIVASCVGSVNLILWKDVDGIMSGDPKSSSSCSILRDITYDQAEKLSLEGAKVLHPLAVSQAEKYLVNIRVKNFYYPFSEGSLIHRAYTT